VENIIFGAVVLKIFARRWCCMMFVIVTLHATTLLVGMCRIFILLTNYHRRRVLRQMTAHEIGT